MSGYIYIYIYIYIYMSVSKKNNAFFFRTGVITDREKCIMHQNEAVPV